MGGIFHFKNKECINFILLSKVLSCLILLYCLWPARFATRYEYIRSGDILDKLVPETTRNISTQRLEECTYEDIIRQNAFVSKNQFQASVINNNILPGGEYYPRNCRSKFSSAVIVPYRNRQSQLTRFLAYMHNFLQKQRIHYRIFLVEQHDSKPFNRAKLLNIGSEIAASYEFPCLIFHDVDLLPSNLGQLYACSSSPRHMCSNLDVFRYNLPYLGLFGGVVSIRTVQFQYVNGMSNLFNGWGGEDDDFYERIKSRKLNIFRFEPSYSEYVMMEHKKETPSEERLKFLHTGPLRYYTDGLNSLLYKRRKTKENNLFTHVLVET